MKAGAARTFDVEALRAQFPGLQTTVHGRPLAYLDSASTAQKPAAVLEAIEGVYGGACANVHRGVHTPSARATAAFEHARERVRAFLGAAAREEIIFTHGATSALNLVASAYGGAHVGPEDQVIVSEMEH
ncbi:MAG: aminotransferase class V-fold PLP-dependent enzyme, partial [Myxococcales bacterium]|nr:aminotransferase class V-fold PLP-dependent enzyme [Myxococcales bacterium]